MKPAILTITAAILSTTLSAQICAGPVALGTLPGDTESWAYAVSSDGDTVVGFSQVALGARHAFRWTMAGGMQDLGASVAHAVSADGSVVVGSGGAGSGAFRWTAAGGSQDLGALPGGSAASAYGVSADGNVVVGSAQNSAGEWRAFRWTAATGVQDLGTLGLNSYANAVSDDGHVVVGTSSVGVNGPFLAFRWTAATGMQSMGTLTGFASSYGNAVSADGSVVVGSAGTHPFLSFGFRAFRWTAAGGMEDLGTLGGARSWGHGVTPDGRIVVGAAEGGSGGPHRAYRWSAAAQMQDLGPVEARGVSRDGSIVVGTSSLFGAFRLQSSVLGTSFCPAVPNSTGCGSLVLANGDPRLATGTLELTATFLPQATLGFFLASRAQDTVVNAGGSQGTLCLGGSIGRLIGLGQVQSSGASGSFTIPVDLNAIPSGAGFVAVQAGDTWNFQCWHRDVNPTATSNFTNAVSITFR